MVVLPREVVSQQQRFRNLIRTPEVEMNYLVAMQEVPPLIFVLNL
jgi:hypothetical protein